MSQRKRRPLRRPVLGDFWQGQPQETNPQLQAAIMAIVDTQLRDGRPPQTRQTFDRLVAAGHSPEGARQLIANVVVAEIFDVMSSGQVYDEARFIAALHRLPKLPSDA